MDAESGSFRAEAAGSKADQDREKNELVKEETRCVLRCRIIISMKCTDETDGVARRVISSDIFYKLRVFLSILSHLTCRQQLI